MKYTIKAGEHYSASKLGLALRGVIGWHLGDKIVKQAKFTKSCLTPTDERVSRELRDTNKLYGLSETLDHHDSSARFGWREYGKAIMVYSYVYLNGVRQKPKAICIVQIDEWYTYELERLEGEWRFVVYNSSGYIVGVMREKAGEDITSFIYRKLYPYYGGNRPAKVETVIYLK